ncbi:MAG: hypothetical protein HN421_03105 [Gammaproteobacteria bacterium]|jgi:flagellar hook-length control protein FliK|nr:hypothetical protein [Gammaproteobacteria bacterium]MBT3844880.1 hypothetical protein [Gammaproteobacteria bacterium]MBT5370810.1 hypothetical protein [Gammaproteobacteria bacterium]MBT6478560.1 hypothetical protein [Gammaproteobacteria bacterium]MBT6653656.1 hypothetical protein [Gammaproteobacteria bacterium]
MESMSNNPLLALQSKQSVTNSFHSDISLSTNNNKTTSESQSAEKSSFSDLLQEKIENKPSSKSETEGNKLPQDGKDERSQTVSNREDKDAVSSKESGDEEDRSTDEQHAEQQNEEAAEHDEEGGMDPRLLTEIVDEEAGEELPIELLALQQEMDEGDGSIEEDLLQTALVGEVSRQESVETQGGVAASLAVAIQQDVQRRSSDENSDALVDEIDLDGEMRSYRQQQGRDTALPPELQKGEQTIQVKEFELQMAMNALKGQQGAASGADGRIAAQGADSATGAVGESLLSLNSMNPASADKAVQLKGMTVPPQSRQWASELGDRILVMAGKKIQTAEIRLNPPNMGILEVKLAINGDQAQLVLQSGNANVRDVLESSIPRLKEMLEQSGITLVDVNIGQREQQQSEQAGEGDKDSGRNGLGGTIDGEMEDEVMSASTMAVDRMGLVDYYI